MFITLSLLLQKKPIIGAATSAAGGATILVDWVSPVVSFLAALVGLGIGIITILLKWDEFKEKRKQKRENEQK